MSESRENLINQSGFISARVRSCDTQATTKSPHFAYHNHVASSRGNRITPEKTREILTKISLCKSYLSSPHIEELENLKEKIEVTFGYHIELQSLNYEELAIIEKSFRKLSRLLAKSEAGEWAFLLATLFNAEHLEANKDENFSNRYAKYAPFCDPGTEKNKELSTTLSFGASLPSFGDEITASASANARAVAGAYSFADDEGQYLEESRLGFGGGVSGTLGFSINDAFSANTSLNADVLVSSGRAYKWNSALNYIDEQGCSVKDPDLNLLKSTTRKFSSKSELERLQKAQQSAAEACLRLEQLLCKEEQIDLNSSFPKQPQPRKIRSNYLTGQINASAFVKFQGFNNGASFDALQINRHTRQWIPETFFEQIKSTPEKIDEFPSSFTAYIRKLFNSFLTYKARTDKEAIKALLRAANVLERDLTLYTQVVTEYDYHKRTTFTNKKQRKHLQTQKHQIETLWGAVGRHELIQFMAASQAWLTARIISFSHQPYADLDKKQTQILERIAEAIANPAFRVNQKRLDKAAKFETAVDSTLKNTTFRANLNVGPFSGRISVSKLTFVHPNNAREGEYLDIEILGSLAAGVQHLSQNQFMDALIKALPKDTLPAGLTITPDFIATGQLSQTIRFFKPKYAEQVDYQGKKGYRKQFSRTRTATDFLGSQSLSAQVLTALSLTASVQGQRISKEVIAETLSPEDINYTRVRFNRFYRNHKKQANNKDWKGLFDKHKESYKQMFLLLTDPRSAIFYDIEFFFSQLLAKAYTVSQQESLAKFKEDFFKSMEELALSPNSLTCFEAAREQFTAFLAELYNPFWEDYKSRAKVLRFDEQAQSAQDLGTKLKKLAGLSKSSKQKFEEQTNL